MRASDFVTAPSSPEPRAPLEAPHALAADEVLARLGTDARLGLPRDAAASRLERWGRNVLPAAPPVPRWRRLLAQFRSPLVLLLLVAGVISLGVWALETHEGPPYEALAILAIVAGNALLGFIQEARAEAAIAALARMTAPTATVVRDGALATVPAGDLVPGDLVVLEEGATVPADARLVEAVSLRAAEAALTGESAPVEKDTAPAPADAALADRSGMVHSGTAITAGHGRAVVVATGPRTEVGRIAGLLHATQAETTPLQAQLDRLGRILGAVVIAIAVVVGVTILVLQRDYSLAALAAVLLYTVALAVSAVPEGLAAVTTVVLSLGMQRMAQRNAIVRKLSAVETLGSANVICSDKTGTLTRNEMTVTAVVTASGRVDLTGTGYAPVGEAQVGGGRLERGDHRIELERALAAAFLANNATLVERAGRWIVIGDPTEGALRTAALKIGLSPERMASRFPRVGEIPFSSARKLMSTAHADAARDAPVLFSKGAPDILLASCAALRRGRGEIPLDAARRAEIGASIEALAGEALRPLGIAYRRLPEGNPVRVREAHETGLVWLGLVGIVDPPRPDAIHAVRAAQSAGVRVIMITGDHPAVAAAIARQVGIATPGGRTVTGVELSRMSEDELRRTVLDCAVYARVAPEHKLAIVRALKSHGAIVAMTGDGVNDAPALKAADIGVAMGITGTDVSKEAADMILADDNFATIVAAIEEGRSIYANIQKFLRYLLSTNLGEVLVMFLGVALAGAIGLVAGEGDPLVLPLLATMILWINLVTDGLPALAVGVDPADPDAMRRPPRDPGTSVITPRMWAGIGVASVVMCVGTLGVLDAGLPGGLIEGDGDVVYARTLAFHTLVLFQLFDVLCIRSDERSLVDGLFQNAWLWLSIALCLAAQAAVLYVPALQKGFGTVALDAGAWALCTAVAATVVAAREGLKWNFRRRDRRAAALARAGS